jgi:enoyl-CoA hydratase/carnithine racemase
MSPLLMSRLPNLQETCSSFETCSKPVVAAVQGACVGAGVDLITACDIRLCAPSASFSVKEVDLAITADLGTLQRLPFIVGEGRARELALTARSINASTALAYGLVSRVSATDGCLEAEGLTLAMELARKPMLAMFGTKRVMLQGRGRPVSEGLTHVALWNASMLWSHELQSVVQTVGQRSRL